MVPLQEFLKGFLRESFAYFLIYSLEVILQKSLMKNSRETLEEISAEFHGAILGQTLEGILG